MSGFLNWPGDVEFAIHGTVSHEEFSLNYAQSTGSSDGFSLIEVLCAFAILALISFSIIRGVEHASLSQRIIQSNRYVIDEISQIMTNRSNDTTSIMRPRDGLDVEFIPVSSRTRWVKIAIDGPSGTQKVIFSERIRAD